MCQAHLVTAEQSEGANPRALLFRLLDPGARQHLAGPEGHSLEQELPTYIHNQDVEQDSYNNCEGKQKRSDVRPLTH